MLPSPSHLAADQAACGRVPGLLVPHSNTLWWPRNLTLAIPPNDEISESDLLETQQYKREENLTDTQCDTYLPRALGNMFSGQGVGPWGLPLSGPHSSVDVCWFWSQHQGQGGGQWWMEKDAQHVQMPALHSFSHFIPKQPCEAEDCQRQGIAEENEAQTD